jgi:hypothetical protein
MEFLGDQQELADIAKSNLERVYLETSFISYLASALQGRHSSDANTAHRQLTSWCWWTRQRHRFKLLVSDTVFRECASGHPDGVRWRLQILSEAESLAPSGAIIEMTESLIEPSGPLPRKAEADAAHIAFAGVYGCHYLLTWNFKHIANALLEPALNKIIQSYGYQPTIICTPEQLLLQPGNRDL